MSCGNGDGRDRGHAGEKNRDGADCGHSLPVFHLQGYSLQSGMPAVGFEVTIVFSNTTNCRC